jgi:hypothetical protein
MMKRFSVTLMAGAAVAAGLTLAPCAHAQLGAASKHDPRVKKHLDAKGIKYEIHESGNISIDYDLGNGRSHRVIIVAETEKYLAFEIREVKALAYKIRGELPVAVANALLVENGEMKLGAWCVTKTKDGFSCAWFIAKIAADADWEALRTAIRFVLETADEMERKLTNKDDF